MRGGPRLGAQRRTGRPSKSHPDMVRSVPIRVMVTPPEAWMLRELADQWDVPMATALYGVLADQLARWRPEGYPSGVPQELFEKASKQLAYWKDRPNTEVPSDDA